MVAPFCITMFYSIDPDRKLLYYFVMAGVLEKYIALR